MEIHKSNENSPTPADYEFLVSPTFHQPLQNIQENTASPSKIMGTPSKLIIQTLYQHLFTICAKHFNAIKEFGIENLQLEKMPNSPNQKLPTIEEDTDEDDSTFRKTPNQISEVLKIKDMFRNTMKKDYQIIENLITNYKKSAKQQEEVKLMNKKMSLLIQENQEMRKMLDETSPDTIRKSTENIKNMPELEKMHSENETLKKKYKELARNLQEINETMSLLEETNKELMQRNETLENEKQNLGKKCKNLEDESNIKNDALDKAQKVIKELYQKDIESQKKISVKCEKFKEMGINSENVIQINAEVMTEGDEFQKIDKMSQKIEENQAELILKDNEIARLRNEIIKAQAEYETTIETLKIAASRINPDHKKATRSCLISPQPSPYRNNSMICDLSPVQKTHCSIITTTQKNKLTGEQILSESTILTPEKIISAKNNTENDNGQSKKLPDPIVPFLLSEIEQSLLNENEIKSKYHSEIVSKLNEHKKVMSDILKPIENVQKELLEAPRRQKEMCVMLSELFHMVDQYSQQNNSLSDILQEKKDIILKLENEIISLKNTIDKMQKDIEKMNEQNKEMCAENSELKTMIDENTVKTANERENYNTALMELKKAQKLINDLAGTLCSETNNAEDLANRIKGLLESEQQCKELRGQLEEFHLHENEISEKYQQSVKSLEVVDQMLKEKERMCMNLRDELNSQAKKTERTKQLKSEMQAMLEKNNNLENEISKLNNENSEMKQMVSELQEKIDEQNDEIIYYKDTSEQKELENNSLKLHLDNAKENYAKEFNDEINQLRKTLESTQELSNELNKKLQLKEDMIEELRARISDVCGQKGQILQDYEKPKETTNMQLTNELKTLKMILLEKSNYISQLERNNNELRIEYERTLKQQLESFTGSMSRSDTTFGGMQCSDCEKLKGQLSTIDQKRDKYKHKFQKRVKEFDLVLKFLQNIVMQKEISTDLQNCIDKICKHNESIKKWLDNMKTHLENNATSEKRYVDFLFFTLGLLEGITKKERIRNVIEKMKNIPELHEMEKIAAEEIQSFLKIHTKCYLPSHIHT